MGAGADKDVVVGGAGDDHAESSILIANRRQERKQTFAGHGGCRCYTAPQQAQARGTPVLRDSPRVHRRFQSKQRKSFPSTCGGTCPPSVPYIAMNARFVIQSNRFPHISQSATP